MPLSTERPVALSKFMRQTLAVIFHQNKLLENLISYGKHVHEKIIIMK